MNAVVIEVLGFGLGSVSASLAESRAGRLAPIESGVDDLVNGPAGLGPAIRSFSPSVDSPAVEPGRIIRGVEPPGLGGNERHR